jgi:hypothetical protein
MNPRYLRRAGLALLALGIAGILVWIGSTVAAARGLLADVRAAQDLADEMMNAGTLDVEVGEVGVLLHNTRRHVVRLDRNVGWLAPVGRAFGWVPRVGPLAREAPELLALADGLTEAGVLFWDDLAPVIDQYQQDASPQDLLPDALAALSNDLDQKRSSIRRVQRAYVDLDPTGLPERFRGPLVKFDELVPLLPGALDTVEVAPEMLGLEEPQTYLIFALNEDELRPTGGLISGVGEVRVAAGEVISMTFRDGYAVDDYSRPYPDPPDPLLQFMGLELWVFRDGMWSPDFPTAVRQTLPLYRPGYPVDVDGVVALDQTATVQLMEAFSPLYLPGVDEAITGETLLNYMHTAWAPDEGEVMTREWWQQRKSFMGDLAGVALRRLKAGDVDWLALGQAVFQVLEERHVQVTFLDPEVADVLALQGWDGGVRAPEGDFLMVVEANVGYNKASAKIDRSITYDVDLRDRIPIGRVTLGYRHLYQEAKPCVPGSRYDPTYNEMMNRCYWTYVRLYTPSDTTLRSASEHPIDEDLMLMGDAWPGDALISETEHHTLFAQAMLLPTASSEEMIFSYELPPSVVVELPDGTYLYRLLIRKQAGVQAVDAHITLRLPENAVLLDATPAFSEEDDTVFAHKDVVTTDLMITVHYDLLEEN